MPAPMRFPARSARPVAGTAIRVTPSAALEQEPITIPKRSLAWLWVMVLLVGATLGSAAVWPAAAKRVLMALGVGHSTPALRCRTDAEFDAKKQQLLDRI